MKHTPFPIYKQCGLDPISWTDSRHTVSTTRRTAPCATRKITLVLMVPTASRFRRRWLVSSFTKSTASKLRHPVGPDAEAFLGWRASLTDEDWVEWGALPDEAWYERVGKDFGLDARSKRRTATGASASPIRARA
jgi:hypothetical protein